MGVEEERGNRKIAGKICQNGYVAEVRNVRRTIFFFCSVVFLRYTEVWKHI